MAEEVGGDEVGVRAADRGEGDNSLDAHDTHPTTHWKRRVTIAALVLTLLAAGLVLPPLVNISRYQRQITALMSRSLGRPVYLSGVELRLLPTPGFVLHDLSVSEDPGFGAEPILSARTVVASVRLFSLWRGKLEVSRISVDEASLNLARTAQGRWNLESVLMGAAEHPGSGSSLGSVRAGAAARRFPYLEATNSRVNLKTGVEKSPFSIVDTDLSLWQDEPGAWRVRLRGQPVRTDLDMSLADTGEVRLEASLHSAAQLREMPLKLQMEWRDVQLGQLSRLVFGSDAGWRGDLTADIQVQGTPGAAQTQARVRATGVRREEFAPETPLDLDANCGFRYQHPQNALHDLDCVTAIGDGRLHLKADLPGAAGPPEGMLEVKQVPLQAGLDLLRTVRSGFAPGMAAGGRLNGSLTYAANSVSSAVSAPAKPAKSAKGKAIAPAGPSLSGSLTLDGGVLKEGGLSEAILLPQIVWTPNGMGIGARFNVPVSKGTGPNAQALTVQVGLNESGYRVMLGGSVGPEKLRSLAYAFGAPANAAADGFAGGTADLDVTAAGPWVESFDVSADSLAGSVQLHHTQWKAGFLAGAVDLPKATVELTSNDVHFDSEFSYPASKSTAKGASPAVLSGSVTVSAPIRCATECVPEVGLRFGALDAGVVQAALSGAPAEKNLLSPLLDRMRTKDAPKWPTAAVEADAESLVLGPVTLRKPQLHMQLKGGDFAFDSWKASVLGGEAHGTGSFAVSDGKPQYALAGDFSQVGTAALGTLLGTHWSGGALKGSGSLQLSGLAEKDLAASATGDLTFDWRGGTVPALVSSPADRPASERFERWSGKVSIKGGKVQLGENEMTAGHRKLSIGGGFSQGGPVRLTERTEAPVKR